MFSAGLMTTKIKTNEFFLQVNMKDKPVIICSLNIYWFDLSLTLRERSAKTDVMAILPLRRRHCIGAGQPQS